MIKSLQVLELQGLVKITDAGIMQLSSLPNLHRVDLSGCTGLSSLVVDELSKKIDHVTWTTDPFDASLYDSALSTQLLNKKKKTNLSELFKISKQKKEGKSSPDVRIEKEKEKDKKKMFNLRKVKSGANLKK